MSPKKVEDNYLTLITDTHIAPNDWFDLEVMWLALKRAIDCAADSKTKYLLHAGDLFDRTKVGIQELSIVGRMAKYAQEKNVTIIICSGNHCLDHKCRSLPSYLGEHRYSHIHVVSDKPGKFWIRSDDRHPNTDILLVVLPYGCDLSLAIDMATKRGFKRSMLLAHGDTCGAKYDSDSVSKSGWSKGEILLAEDVFDLIAIGHIHKPQTITNKTFYIGAILQYNFRACKQKRGFIKVSFDNFKTRERVVLVGGDWPEFEKISYDDFIANVDGNALAGKYLRVDITQDTYENYSEIDNDAIVSGALDAGAVACKVNREPKIERIARRTDIDISDSMQVVGEKYIRAISDDEEETEELLKIHERVLRKAEAM